MTGAVSALVALGVIGAAWFAIVSGTRPRRRRARAETTLLRQCQGDREQVDRLISDEIERTPSVSRVEAVERAVERRRRDNR